MHLLTLLFVLPTLYLLLSRLHRIHRNYRLAVPLGLPIVIAPMTWQDPLWMFLAPYFLFLSPLPWFRSWLPYSYMGWTTADKGRIHRPVSEGGLGPAFVLVSANRTEVFTTSPKTAVSVNAEWRTFTKPVDLYGVFDLFGKNVNTVNGGEWQRHRKVTGGAFRESTYALTWRESREHGRWVAGNRLVGKREMSVAELREEMSRVTMHVLSGAAFGKVVDPAKGEGVLGVEKGHRLSYFECLSRILPNLMGAMLFGGAGGLSHVPDGLLPGGMRRMKEAAKEYRLYMAEAVARQMEKGLVGQAENSNLASQLLRANEAAKLEGGGGTGRLSESELYGNMFIFGFAGFETTSMALTFSLPYLALDLELQDWVREEVEIVAKEEGGLDDYGKCFDRMIRCRAVMYETLRLINAVAHVPRQTPVDAPSTIIIPSLSNPEKEQSITIPPNSLVSVPIVIFGYLPSLFPSPEVYDPRRYLLSAADTTSSAATSTNAPLPPRHTPFARSSHHEEVLIHERILADRGFLPWTSGPRVCPGKKFSQVEFVAVLAEILLKTTVRVRGGQDERLRAELGDVVFNLGTRLKREGEVGVEFVAR